MAKTKISVVILGLLVLTSFIPVLQVLIMYLNGAILALIGSLLGKDGHNIEFMADGLMTLLFLILFYFTKGVAAKILSAIGVIIFFLPWLLYATENVISNEKYYFLQFLIIGAIVGSVLILIEVYKIKFKTP